MDSKNIIKDEKLNQIKTTKFHFSNLKSDFIFKKIIMLMKRNKSLSIMKYNKKLQKRLNININDYKEYGKILIELEIIPERDFNLDYFDNYFINSKKYDKSYYHIYFDNNKEEINRPFITLFEKVRKIKIIIDYDIKSFDNLFSKCKNIKKISFLKFQRKNITDMSYMFNECSSLKELNLSNFNTENVTNMSYMFYGCSSLKELNLSNFITNKVTDVSHMFCGCSSLKVLNISNFNTDNVENKGCIFNGCTFLKESDFSCFINNELSFNKSITYANSILKEMNFFHYIRYQIHYFRDQIHYIIKGLKKRIRKKIFLIKEKIENKEFRSKVYNITVFIIILIISYLLDKIFLLN